jgi:hypothetical protein
MFAVDHCAVRGPHALARGVRPLPPAARSLPPSPNLPAQRSACKKIEAAQQEKPRTGHAHTFLRSSHFLSATCVLLPRSFPKERKLTHSFSIACALFCEKVGGIPTSKITCSHATICKLGKVRITEKSKNTAHKNRATGAATNRSTTDARPASLCYCLRSPAPRCAACSTHHKFLI